MEIEKNNNIVKFSNVKIGEVFYDREPFCKGFYMKIAYPSNDKAVRLDSGNIISIDPKKEVETVIGKFVVSSPTSLD